MNTRPLPAIIMLIAGLITCLIAIITKIETVSTLKTLLLVLVGFYILGLIVKIIIDKSINIHEKIEISEETDIPDIDTSKTTAAEEN